MVDLLVDLNIEGRPLAVGQRVSLSPESEKLLIRKQFAKAVGDDKDSTNDIHGGGRSVHERSNAKDRVKGRGKH
jgi:hypothetical protein